MHAVRPTLYPGSRRDTARDCARDWGRGGACVLGRETWLEFNGCIGSGQAECTAGGSKHTLTAQEHRVLGDCG